MRLRRPSDRSSQARSVGTHTGRTALDPSSSLISSGIPHQQLSQCNTAVVQGYSAMRDHIKPFGMQPFQRQFEQQRILEDTAGQRHRLVKRRVPQWPGRRSGRRQRGGTVRRSRPAGTPARVVADHRRASTGAGSISACSLRAVDVECVSDGASGRHGTYLPARSPPALRRPPPGARRQVPIPRRTVGPCSMSVHSRSRFQAGAPEPSVPRRDTRQPGQGRDSMDPAAHRCASAIR